MALMRLRVHFRRMGFRRLGRSPYYVLPTALRTPHAGDPVKPRSKSDT
jgi:hypothetical protein